MFEEEDISVVDVCLAEAEHEKIDDSIAEIEGASEDITAGHSLDDGDIIDSVALTDTVKKVDKDVVDMVDDSLENPIDAVNRSTKEDPTDADYKEKYPELHTLDVDDDTDDEITERDFELIVDEDEAVEEGCIDSFTIKSVVEAMVDENLLNE